MSPRSIVARLAATIATLLLLVAVEAYPRGGPGRARAVSQQTDPPVTFATPASTGQRDQLLAALDSALLRADWAAATRISAGLRVAFPRDDQIAETAFAAHVGAGDAALERGQRDEAARLYRAARQIREDPLVAERLAAVILTRAGR